MKLAIIGGSAQSTPLLFCQPSLRELAPQLKVLLIGRSIEHLQAVRRAIEVLNSPTVYSISYELADSDDAAFGLKGSDLVLCQARYGGNDARAFDERFPIRFGMCGDEGLGAGGLAAAWRGWPHLERTLASLSKACPQAQILLMTAPLGLLSRCAFERFPSLSIRGICELPWTTLLDISSAVGTAPAAVDFDYAGVNHLGWLYGITCGDRNIMDEYCSTRVACSGFPSADLIRKSEAIPLKYLRLHYLPEVAFSEQHDAPSRAEQLKSLASRSYEAFSRGDLRDIESTLASRPSPWYEYAVAPFIGAAFGLDCKTKFFLTVPGSEDIGCSAKACLEVAHGVVDGAIVRLARRKPVPSHVMTVLADFVAYEQTAAAAVLTRDLKLLQDALICHPWTRNAEVAAALSSEIVSHESQTELV